MLSVLTVIMQLLLIVAAPLGMYACYRLWREDFKEFWRDEFKRG
jgi:hypothetical protein|tara:strand:- start:6545 stop:6676 length:132 start_codon:yes stop_codon:yes gene_type:complete